MFSVDAAVATLCTACVTVCSAPPGGDDADVPSFDQLFYSHEKTNTIQKPNAVGLDVHDLL